MCYYYLKKVLCNFALFMKTHQTILCKKTCFHGGFEFFKENSYIYKEKCEQSQNEITNLKISYESLSSKAY